MDNAALIEAESKNPFIGFLNRFQKNPSLFVRECLGVEPDKWQEDFLDAIAGGHRRISIRSGHGVGKSTAASWAMLWYLLTRHTVKILVTAPSSGQLFDGLFAEAKRWVRQMPSALQQLVDVKSDRIELASAPAECFISLKTSRPESLEALAGAHADFVMLIADEASGVLEGTFEASAGSMSGENAVTILLGNPTRTSGLFYDTHPRLRNEWWTRKVSCVDSPRVSAAYIAELQSRYGAESNAYRVRVLGEFAKSDEDTVVSLATIESAIGRDVAMIPAATTIWGLDIARKGNDASALCKRKGNHILEPVRRWRGLDLMQLTGAIVAEYEGLEPENRPTEICVDSIGLGAGVVDRLREILDIRVHGINVSESPALGTTYRNLRAELYYKAKAWFEGLDVCIPADEQLISELSIVRYKFSSNGKIILESKDEIKKRLNSASSPDCADAFVLTFAGTASRLASGSAAGANWSKPLRRNLPRIKRR